jgi:hypothetical protein
VAKKVPLCEFAVDMHTRMDVTSLPEGVLVKQFDLGELGVFTQLTKESARLATRRLVPILNWSWL